MKYIITAILMLLCGGMQAQGSFEGDQVFLKSSYDAQSFPTNKNLAPKCLDIQFFVDKSVSDSLGWMPTQSVINAEIANSQAAYEEINIFINPIITYLDSSYLGTNTTQVFNNFIGTRYVGDIAHLLTFTGGGGGIAAVGQINRYYPYAVSVIQTGTSGQSWNRLVLAHESGHVIGSKHTHDDAWNGNNTPIDSCGYGFNPYPDFGTIMSYCHLFGRTEFHFHPQVAQLFHNVLDFYGFGCTPPVTECESEQRARIIMNDYPGETTWRWGTSTGGPYPKDSIDVDILACATECDTLFIYDAAGDGFVGSCQTGFVTVGGVSYTFGEDSLVVVFCENPVSEQCVDLSSTTEYIQTSLGESVYQNGELELSGNIWVSDSLSYLATESTMLTFEYRADGKGEIQGIGVSDWANPFSGKIWNLSGRHFNVGDRSVRVPDNNQWTSVRLKIPVGQVNNVWLIQDNDAQKRVGVAAFRNICFEEAPEIENILPEDSERMFNTMGQRVYPPLRSGIYFKENGEKVFIFPR
jgi:hypothetical protein